MFAAATTNGQRRALELRWVKPSFVAGGAVSLSIYGKICISHFQILSMLQACL